jgi:hypothetical protein
VNGVITTYSFLDVSAVFYHPAVGRGDLSGEGIGSITTVMAGDRTQHDVAADGSIMVSKIGGNNGTVSISIQQKSLIHKMLLGWWNYIKDASTPSSEYAAATITIRTTEDPNGGAGEEITCTGVSPQKTPDKPFQAQGQQVVWNLMAADIDQN